MADNTGITAGFDFPRLGSIVARRARLVFPVVGWMCWHMAFAQDARAISEPVVPPSCTVLSATLADPDALTDSDDTARLQQAIDHCPAGQAVQLTGDGGKRAFVSGPLTLRSGVTLLIDAGATLYASNDPRMYDKGEHTCGTNNGTGKGCKPFISVADARGSGIMGDGAIDGQGGKTMLGKRETWWQLARRAQKEHLSQNVPHLITIDRSTDFTLYRITLRNSLEYHVVMHRVDGFTAWGVKIDTPGDARNTDGIDPISSRNVTVTHSYIRAGDDNISIKSGSEGPSENISIVHNHFYAGHGMSIGSNTDGGVRHVLVDDLSMDGTTSGLRIKSDVSRGGLVSDIHYDDICLRGVRAPLDVDTAYTRDAHGDKIPLYRDIFFDRVHSVTPGRFIFQGVDDRHPLGIALSDVVIDGFADVNAAHAHFTLGPGAVRPIPSGSDVQTEGVAGTGAGIACEGRFEPFPIAGANVK